MMRVFVRVAELQSFSQAAESMNLPRATVTTSIQDLEALVGAKLLNRTTRSVQLSSDGAAFLERSKDLLSDLDEAESMFKSDPAQIKGKIRIDMTQSMARDFFIPLLPKFLEKHPGIEIELSGTDHRVDLIRDGIDCVIRSDDHVEPGLIERKIGAISMVNVASHAYLKKFGKPKSIDDLKNHRLIYFTQVLGSRPRGFEYFDGEKYREIKMPSSITVNNVDTYKAACLAGLGICQNPLVGVERFIKSGDLVEILPKYRAEPMNLKIVYQQRRSLAKRVRVLIDWLEPHLKERIKST